MLQDEEDEEFGEEEVDSDDEDLPDPGSNKFFVQEIRVHGLPEGKGIPTKVPPCSFRTPHRRCCISISLLCCTDVSILLQDRALGVDACRRRTASSAVTHGDWVVQGEENA